MTIFIPIALTLKKACRNAEVQAEVQQIAGQLGLESTGKGTSTLSCRVTPARFAELFGRAAKVLSSRPPGETDYGAPGGFEGDDLPVPAELVPFLDSIAIVPPATRLHKPAG